VHERLLHMPAARELDNLPIATGKPEPQPPLEGYKVVTRSDLARRRHDLMDVNAGAIADSLAITGPAFSKQLGLSGVALGYIFSA
jgi:hypothetical protein